MINNHYMIPVSFLKHGCVIYLACSPHDLVKAGIAKNYGDVEDVTEKYSAIYPTHEVLKMTPIPVIICGDVDAEKYGLYEFVSY